MKNKQIVKFVSFYPFFASVVSGEVINRHFDAFSFLQLSKDVDEQLKVEGVRVIEVILVFSSQILLFFIQHLKNERTRAHK